MIIRAEAFEIELHRWSLYVRLGRACRLAGVFLSRDAVTVETFGRTWVDRVRADESSTPRS